MDSKSHLESIKEKGFTIIKNALQDDVVEKLILKIRKISESHKNDFYPGFSNVRKKDKQIFNLQNKDVYFVKFLDILILNNILESLLNDQNYRHNITKNYILGELIARQSGDPLSLHIDSWMPSDGENTWMLQVAFVLEKRSANEGCTIIVPKSHRSGKFAKRDSKTFEKIEADKGDILIWDSRLWHGALPSDNSNWVIIATFQRWWVKQRFDIPKTLEKKIFNKLSIEEKILLGFASIPFSNELIGTDSIQGTENLLDWDKLNNLFHLSNGRN